MLGLGLGLNPGCPADEVSVLTAVAGANEYTETDVLKALDGSGSFGPNPITTYTWTFTSVPPGSALTDLDITDADTATPSFTPDISGPYVLELEVGDGSDTDTDTVTITANYTPVADAGSAPTDYRPTEQFDLDGSGSSDADVGDTITYTWTLTDNPVGSSKTTADILNANTDTPSFTADVIGDYEFTLVVSDGIFQDTDTVTVTVVANQLPAISAGSDANATVDEVTNLTGTITTSDPEGDSLTYAWTFVGVADGSALDDGDITNNTSLSASFTPDVEGDFTLRLTVTDTFDGQTVTDDVVISAIDLPLDGLEQRIADANAGPLFESTAGLEGMLADYSPGIGTRRLPLLGYCLDFAIGTASVAFTCPIDIRDVSAQEVSISVWINLDSPASDTYFFAVGTAAAQAMLIGHANSKIKFLYGIGAGWVTEVASSSVFVVNTWHHVVITRDSSGVYTVYVDGSVHHTFTQATDLVLTNPTTAKWASSHLSASFDGSLRMGQIYDYCLDSDEVTYLKTSQKSGVETTGTAPETPPVVKHDMNESTGTLALDSSGNGAHATITAGTWTTQDEYESANEVGYTLSDGATYYAESGLSTLITANVRIPRDESNTTKCVAYQSGPTQSDLQYTGRSGYPAQPYFPVCTLDGVNDYFDISGLPAITALGGTGAWSIGLWYYHTAYVGTKSIVSLGSGTGSSQVLIIYPNDLASGNGPRIFWNNAVGINLNGSELNLSAWNHILLVYDGSDNLILYLDGVQVGSATGIGLVTLYSTVANIGRYPNGPQYGIGRISDMQFWDSELSSTNAATLAAGGEVSGYVARFVGSEGAGNMIMDVVSGTMFLGVGMTTAELWANKGCPKIQYTHRYGFDLGRYFDSTDDYVEIADFSSGVSGYPYTVMAKIITRESGSAETVWFLGSNASDTAYDNMYIRFDGKVVVGSREGTSAEAISTTRVYDGTVHTIGAIHTSTTSRTVSVDATNEATNTDSKAFGGTVAAIGRLSRLNPTQYGGFIAIDLAVYASVLSEAEQAEWRDTGAVTGKTPVYHPTFKDAEGDDCVDEQDNFTAAYVGTTVVRIPTNVGTSTVRDDVDGAPSDPAGTHIVNDGGYIDMTGGVASPMAQANAWETSFQAGDARTNPEYARDKSTKPIQADRLLAYESEQGL